MLALMEAVPAAARAAAAAYQQAWCEYELADVRQEGGGEAAVIDGGLPEEAQRMGRRLAAIAGNEVLQVRGRRRGKRRGEARGSVGSLEGCRLPAPTSAGLSQQSSRSPPCPTAALL